MPFGFNFRIQVEKQSNDGDRRTTPEIRK